MPETSTAIHFFVNRTHLTTERRQLTGAEIKAMAGVDPTDLLELRDEGRRLPIQNDQLVDMKEGQHFITYPGGRDS